MCGIAGFIRNSKKFQDITRVIEVMNYLQSHRGPDDTGVWVNEKDNVGLGHRRLSIIDLSEKAHQPMEDGKAVIVYNGEIYNYLELREMIGVDKFESTSDTEVILKSYHKWGHECVKFLRGMFAFAIWDKEKKLLFCARDRFGIKPFYYARTKNGFFFASETKAILPFMDAVETDYDGLKEYLTFQFTLNSTTLFKNIKQLPPAHYLIVRKGESYARKYWEVHYTLDWFHTKDYFKKKIQETMWDSIRLHLRSDVEIGAYLSGGLDSSIVCSLARKIKKEGRFYAFTGKFTESPQYDESHYAKEVARYSACNLKELEITCNDFLRNIERVIYYLDYPTAGPGSFPQYMVSKLASSHLKVVLGGQGGDEIFGGYTRYLIAYFEQCIKGAIEGTMHSGNFVVTYESIIPNLETLRDYIPLLKEFWKEGLFDSRDKRYFRLINRAADMTDIINWDLFREYSAFDTFSKIFWQDNVEKESYFDSMTHFDFKTLLPSLLHVEDRMSMAHSLESRVPFLDHPLVELVATIPSNIKFKNGELKHIEKESFAEFLPRLILERKDKKGFPVPLTEWLNGELHSFVVETLSSKKARAREYLSDNFNVLDIIGHEKRFSRRLWALLSLEIWQQLFHDKEMQFKKLYESSRIVVG